MNNPIHDIAVQRNELRRCLGKLCDQIRHGAYNHMFKEANPRAHNNDDKPCEKGHKRDDVIWCQGRCCGDCNGCAKNCPLSFEEKRLFDAMNAAESVLGQPDSEMPSVEPKDFPVYDPKAYSYQATDRWLVRNFYRFAVGYWAFANHDDKEQEKAWERAFDDLLTIGMDHIGKDGTGLHDFISKLNELQKDFPEPNDEAKAKAKKLRDEHPDVVKLINEAVEFIFGDKKEKEINLTYLVFNALTLRMDYEFGHEYPGGDMDVYDGAFCGLIDIALKLVGLDSDNEPWQGDEESDAAYAKRLAEANAQHKEKIYAFMAETDGLTVQKKA